jgi:hypothetical protein
VACQITRVYIQWPVNGNVIHSVRFVQQGMTYKAKSDCRKWLLNLFARCVSLVKCHAECGNEYDKRKAT